MTAVKDLLDLQHDKVLVTGANGPIGQAIARRCVEAGATVAVHYRQNADNIETMVQDLGDRVVPIQADLSHDEGLATLISTLAKVDFVPTAIVNNAADQSVADLIDISSDQWRQMMTTNVDSIFAIGQHAAKHWQNCHLVNISSIESLDPAQGHAHYCTSKAALNMLTRAQALEFGKLGMRINSISPGLIRREGIEEGWPEGVARWQSRAPLVRMGEVDDIADAVLFLISDAARWISGANLVVDGGMTAQSKW